MLGLTKQQKIVVLGSWLGWSLDGYDLVLMLLVIPLISELFFPLADPTFALLATFAAYVVTLIMRPFGGAFLGIFVVLSEQWNLDGRYSLLAAVGFCGSLTTMSSFALDSSNLLDNQHYATLAINMITNIGLSIGALIAGKSIMTVIVNG